MMEEWRDIPGYEGSYQVSNLGRVKSLSRIINKKKYSFFKKEKYLPGEKEISGYLQVALYKNDIGKVFKVFRGVASSGSLITTVLSVQSATQVTLNATNSSGSNITSGRALYGTNDQTAIQDAINACDDGGGGTVFFPNGNYIVTGAPQSTITYNAVSYNANCILFIPYKSVNDYERTHIVIKGETRPNFTASSYLNNTGPKPYFNGGVNIISTYKGTGIGKSGVFGWLYSGSLFSYNYASFKDISIFVDAGLANNGPGVGGINGQYSPSVIAEFLLIGHDEMLYESVQPLNDCNGISTTLTNSDSMNQIRNCFCYGFDFGFRVGEHTVLDHTQAFGCNNGYGFIAGYHSIHGQRVMSVGCISQIQIIGACSFIIDNFDVEAITAAFGPSGRWYEYALGVNDFTNLGAGKLNYLVIKANFGKDNSIWNKSGGTGVTATAI